MQSTMGMQYNFIYIKFEIYLFLPCTWCVLYAKTIKENVECDGKGSAPGG